MRGSCNLGRRSQDLDSSVHLEARRGPPKLLQGNCKLHPLGEAECARQTNRHKGPVLGGAGPLHCTVPHQPL